MYSSTHGSVLITIQEADGQMMFFKGQIFRRKFRIFCRQRRSYYSLILLSSAFILSLFAELICNRRPLLIRYQSRYYAPFLFTYPETKFGGDFKTEADYKDEELVERLSTAGNFVWYAPIPFGPEEVDFDLNTQAPSKPDSRHLLGTDDRARDVLARLIYGFRISFLFAIALATLGTVLGVLAGAIQGYFGGLIDLIGQRITELWSSLPELFLLIILSSIFEPSIWVMLILMACMGWTGLSAYVRAEFLKTREYDYVRSPVALGAGNLRIMLLHILPNTLAPVISFFPFRVSAAITGLASLDFLGLGVPPPTPSLGELLSQGKSNLQCWWIIASAFLLLVTTILCLNFIGEGVQRAMAPQGDPQA